MAAKRAGVNASPLFLDRRIAVIAATAPSHVPQSRRALDPNARQVRKNGHFYKRTVAGKTPHRANVIDINQNVIWAGTKAKQTGQTRLPAARKTGDLRNKEVTVVTSERTINWNLTPAPKLFCANNSVAEGIDFREFGIEGDGSFDYECSVVQIVVNIDSALKVRSAATEEFRESRPAGTSLICLPQERIKGEWRGNARFLGAYLTPHMVERTFERPFNSIKVARGETASPIVEYLLKALRADVLRGSPGGPAFIQSVVVSLLHHLQISSADHPGPAKGGLSRKQLNVLHELIDAQLDGQLSLEQLSREVGVSSGYLSRAFKVSMGVSPHQYILQVRVARAKHLIRGSDQTLDEIAERVGFADGSHMTTVFLKVTGKSPSQFRNR